MGIIANYTAYPADYIDAVIRDGDGENDTELAEYGLEKDSLLLHLALPGADDFIGGNPLSEAVIGSVLLGADDEDDAFDASIFATPAARVAEIAAALDRADINALITQHAAALQGYDRQDDAAGLRALPSMFCRTARVLPPSRRFGRGRDGVADVMRIRFQAAFAM